MMNLKRFDRVKVDSQQQDDDDEDESSGFERLAGSH